MSPKTSFRIPDMKVSMKHRLIWIIILFFPYLGFSQSLWEHCQQQNPPSGNQFTDAKWNRDFSELQLSHHEAHFLMKKAQGLKPHHPSWYELDISTCNQNFNSDRYITTEVKNTGNIPLELMFWVVGSNGWGASGETQTIQPGEDAVLKADLRATYPDNTPKLNPNKLKSIRWMFKKPKSGQKIAISDLKTEAKAEPWSEPPGMLNVPEMIKELPAAGKRVRFQLQNDAKSSKYFALYLPTDWQAQKTYPVIFEYPGNIFYNTKACYSTGRPESCAMGYGITQGQGSIWVSLPFINETTHGIAVNGFGSQEGEDTLTYALKVIDLICDQFGGDRNNLTLCGFSRGSIACGYIGLRNDTIASHWKAIIGCQHYDGSKWNQSNMADAVKRAPRFTGQAIFQVDNSKEKYQPVVDATSLKVEWTFTESGLNYHSTTMFLDNRPMMIQLRNWYKQLVSGK